MTVENISRPISSKECYNLQGMSNPTLWEKNKKYIKLSSAKFAQSLVRFQLSHSILFADVIVSQCPKRIPIHEHYRTENLVWLHL